MDQTTTAIHPSAATGIDTLPTDRQERILRYVDAAIAAKDAGVDGAPIRYPQSFVDQVARQRVVNARGGADWPACVAEMDADEAAWATRIAARAPRALAKSPTNAPAAGAATRLLRRADTLTPEQRGQLTECWEATILRDADRAQELLPTLVQPHFASLRFRALEAVGELRHAEQLRSIAGAQSKAVQAAALATFAGDRLAAPLRAVLLGPWAAVVEGDPTELEAAWSDDADDLRSDFTTLDPDAWSDPRDCF
jgi:hypothetical protein